MSHPHKRWAFWSELRMICHRARQVWTIVPNKDRWSFGGAALLMTITSLSAIAVSVTLGRLVDDMSLGVQNHQPRNDLLWTAGLLLGIIAILVLLREAFNVLRRYLVENTCTRLDKLLSVKVVSHMLRVDLGSLTHEKVGSLNGRISRSVDGFMRFLRMGFLDFFPVILTGLMALLVTFCKAPLVGLVMVGVIPVSVALTARQLLSQKDIRLKLNRTREELDGTVVELLGGLDYVRVANTHIQEVKRFAHAAETRRQTELKHHVAMALFGSAKALTEGFFHLVVLASAVYLAVIGWTTFGDILAFSALFMSVMTPMAEVHRILDEGHEASLRVGDLMEMLTQPIDESYVTVTHKTPRLDDRAPVIATEGLCVDYKTADGRLVRALDNINLKIQPGETVGVVGRSGGGKSTLIKVLMRIIHASKGQGFLKGIPLADASRETISQLIGYVGQSPFIFSGTIEDNIRYGCAFPVLPEDVRRAAERACIHHEIMAMPNGYRTVLAERGANLSGGQRQRIALARIFLKDPPVLILDEATSALDTISERSVQEVINAARADRTVILVAHRLSTLCDADRILVFDSGRLVEEGTYHELVKLGGIFTELVDSTRRGVMAEELDGFLPGPVLTPAGVN
jgi:ATP-binding cassette subfamily B protein